MKIILILKNMEENVSAKIEEAEVVDETKKSNKSVLVISLVVVALIIFSLSRGKDEDKTVMEALPVSTEQPIKEEVIAMNDYKDGVYEVKGDYVSPGGDEQIDVKLTLKGNVVSEAEVVSLAVRPNSVKFQGQFVAGYKEFVVGKNIDEINIQKVSGSSLTPKGFKDALEKIKVQAKS
mgnify:FL=1